MVARLRRARWAGSRRNGSRRLRTSPLLPTCPAGGWIDLVHGRRPPRGIVLDMDSSVIPKLTDPELMLRAPHRDILQKQTVVQWDIGAVLKRGRAADESASPQS